MINDTTVKNKKKKKNSLEFEWLGLHASTAGAQVWSLVGELRSRMPCGAAKKKSNNNKVETTQVKVSISHWVCLTLCDPTDCSLPGSSVHGTLQARILEWVAISFSRGSSRPRDRTWFPILQADSLQSKPPGRPQVSINLYEWIYKMYFHTMEYYSAIKKEWSSDECYTMN